MDTGSDKENRWKPLEIGLKVAEVLLLFFALVAGADPSLKLSIQRINEARYQLYFEGKSEGATDSYKFVDSNRDGEKFGCTDFQQTLYPQNGSLLLELNMKDTLPKYAESLKPEGDTRYGFLEIYFHISNVLVDDRTNYKATIPMNIWKEGDRGVMDSISTTTPASMNPYLSSPCENK